MEIREYDEHDAVRFIRAQVGDEISSACSENDLLLLIDTLFDFFETNDNDDDDEFDPDFDTMVKWVTKQLARDKECKIAPEHVGPIIEAELAYEDTLFDF